MDSLRARVARGEISQDSVRALMAGLRARGGAAGGQRAAPVDPAQPRPAVVFLMSADGRPEAHAVMIGLNDWDNTQVVSGLDEGAEIAVIGAAQLQAAQAEQLQRMRDRMGGSGPFPGGGRR